MVGVATGAQAGAFVLDLDAGIDKETGQVFEVADLRAEVEREIGEVLPDTLTADTPRGGEHRWHVPPAGTTCPAIEPTWSSGSMCAWPTLLMYHGGSLEKLGNKL